MQRISAGLIALLLLLASCGTGDDASAEAADTTDDRAGETHSSTTTGVEEGADGDEGAGRETAAAYDASTTSAPGAAEDGVADQAPADAVGLEAGSVDDNEEWEAYLRYREAFAALGIRVDDLPVGGRRVLTVTDEDGVPVLDARIVVEGAGQTTNLRTGADGRAVFLAPVAELDEQQSGPAFTATVTHGEAETTTEIGPEPRQTVVLEGVEHDRDIQLDVLFLIDATGSMSDEIERLKANMIGVAQQIASSDTRPDVRFGLTHYRDEGDEYVSRTVDFTADVGSFVDSLRGVVADGGGDTPEALNEAFAAAVGGPAWRTDEDVVRLVFLVADAPPHIGRGTSYVETIGAAAAEGIRVFPIASSGTDDQAEFVFRQIAQATLGRFVFLSYGADGAAVGSESNLDDEDYDVLALDELVVRLVEEQLAPLADR